MTIMELLGGDSKVRVRIEDDEVCFAAGFEGPARC